MQRCRFLLSFSLKFELKRNMLYLGVNYSPYYKYPPELVLFDKLQFHTSASQKTLGSSFISY